MAASDARPVPRKNAAFRFYFAIRKPSDSTLITTWAGQDSEVSLDGAAFSDCTNEATEIGTTGCGYLDLTASEMNADAVILKITVTNTGAVPLVFTLFPEEVGDYRVNVEQFGGSAGSFASGRPAVNASYIGGVPVTATTSITFPSTCTVATTTGAVGSVTGAVGSVTGAVGSVTGAVGSIATGGIAATSFAAGAIDAAAIATGAIDADALAADAVTEIWAGSTAPSAATIADAVWDEDATGHQTQGTFGQAIGDPVADTNTIYKAVVTDAAGATVGVDVAAVLDDTGTAGVVVASLAAGSITAATIATGAIDADALAADAGTEIGTAVWATTTRVLTAGTNVDGSTFTAIPWNAAWDAEVQSEVQDAVEANHLDHLLAVTYDPASKPGAADALLNELVESDAGVARYTANALEQAPTGGSAPTASQIADEVQTRTIAGVTLVATTTTLTNLPTIPANWLTAAGTAADFTTEIQSGLATAANLATVAGYLDTEIAAILEDTGTTIPAQIAALNNLSAAAVNAEVDTALADYDGPTNAEMVARTPSATAIANVETVFNTDFASNYNTTVDAWNVSLLYWKGDSMANAVSGSAPAHVYTMADNVITAAKIADGAIDTATFASGATLPRVTLVDTTTTNTDMRGTDGAMLAYTQPTGFLAATFPGTVSSYAGGAVASVTGNVGGNVTGSVGSVLGGINTTGGTITTLDQLDTAQDSQHTTTQGLVTTADNVVDAIKVKTDQLTFGVANTVNANITYVNETAVGGTGATGDEWGPA